MSEHTEFQAISLKPAVRTVPVRSWFGYYNIFPPELSGIPQLYQIAGTLSVVGGSRFSTCSRCQKQDYSPILQFEVSQTIGDIAKVKKVMKETGKKGFFLERNKKRVAFHGLKVELWSDGTTIEEQAKKRKRTLQ